MTDTHFIYVSCPHCNDLVEINISEINCAIFRHGIYKNTIEQIDPHASKDFCDNLVKKNAIFGCGNPFKLFYNKNPTTNVVNYYTEKCDYI
jgi:hypothetical protein